MKVCTDWTMESQYIQTKVSLTSSTRIKYESFKLLAYKVQKVRKLFLEVSGCRTLLPLCLLPYVGAGHVPGGV
jgi:hypothetical protein